MAYCPSCGEEIADGAEYCSACGTDLSSVGDGIEQRPDSTQDETPVSDGNETPQPTTGEQQTPPTGQTAQQPTAESGSVLSRWNTNQMGVMAGGVVGGLSAFLPWLSITVLGTSQTMYGIDGDGKFTLIAAVLAVLAAAYTWNRWSKVIAVLAGLLITALGLLYILEPTAGLDMAGFTLQQRQIIQNGLGPSIGLYGTLLGGLTILASVALDHV